MLNVNYNDIENCNIGILKIEILNFVVSYIGILNIETQNGGTIEQGMLE